MLATFVLAIACLYFAREIFIPFILAVLLTFLLTPLVNLLQRARLPRVVAVIVTVLFAFSLVGGLGWLVYAQVTTLANDLPQYKHNVTGKIRELRRAGTGGTLEKAQSTVKEVIGELQKDDPNARKKPAPVVVEQTPELWRIPTAIGPLLELLARAGLVVVLVIFMLIERQGLVDRLIRLGGYGRLTMTTRVLDESGARISRYLLMQTLINSGFGLAVGAGLFFIGVPYALLWGVLAGAFRFLPYVGPWLGASLPMILSLAVFPGWIEPLEVLAVFVVIELAIYVVVEPLLFSHSAGVSPLALLVTVAFWTWLWGPIGLVLGTPLTVCLVVLGKHVPELDFIVVLFGDEQVIPPDAALYQRLLKGDEDEALDVVEAQIKTSEVTSVYDDVIVPALGRARADRLRGVLSEEEERAIVHTSRAMVEALGERVLPIATARDGSGEGGGRRPIDVLACPARDEIDEIALIMLGHLLDPARVRLQIVSAERLASETVAVADDRAPAVVVIGSVAPGGLAHIRYLAKRLRSRLPDVPIVVGRWCPDARLEEARVALTSAGVTEISISLAETRDQVLALTLTFVERVHAA
ncbi:MAG TPA: AI-2E family transporter [Methylomirabilota bacterium]|nr:AI-2E family transporter [Methylomirabilota bacterium]